MGCKISKVETNEAVALCRERCVFLDEAIKQRFALAEAHMGYMHSLGRIGPLIHNFIEHQQSTNESGPTEDNKGHSGSPEKAVITHLHSSVGSDLDSASHLNFDSDSEDGEDETLSLHHSDHSLDSSPLHDDFDYQFTGFPDYAEPSRVMYPGKRMHMNFMEKNVTPSSVVYQWKSMSPGRAYYVGEPSVSSYPYPGTRYLRHSTHHNGAAIGDGYSSYGILPAGASSKPPAPPPSPPRASGWEYLNLFEGHEQFYPLHMSSHFVEALVDEEDIPHLEDVVDQGKDFGEVGSDRKSDQLESSVKNYKYPPAPRSSAHDYDSDTSLHETSSTLSVSESEELEREVHEQGKTLVENESKEEETSAERTRDASNEIEIQFLRASESANEIAKMLEVGKLPYKRKHAASSKMSGAIIPSLPLISSSSQAGLSGVQIEADVAMRSNNLSSTLHKLYLWEKKLYREVKAEEKVRMLYEKNFRKLKRLDEMGAEGQKIHSTRTLVRSLSTKLRFSIQVVDKTSVRISKIRDEELWPLLDELMHGLNRMWKSMLECHRIQCQAIRETNGPLLIRPNKEYNGDSGTGANHEIENELICWMTRFSMWINAQKGYIRALNGWLLKCLLYEPEETPDGVPPFSPGRIGAPLVFIICNQWSQAMERVSEKEVTDSIRDFSMKVLKLWEQDRLEIRQNMFENKDYEGKDRDLKREEEKILKEIKALERKLLLPSGSDGNGLSVSEQVVYQSNTVTDNLQAELERIFEALERFTAESVKLYEDLFQRVEEERVTGRNQKPL